MAQTVTQIRALTSGPVWNAETGVAGASGTRGARYAQFISDMHAAGLLGFTHFNEGSYLLTASEVSAVCAAVNQWDA